MINRSYKYLAMMDRILYPELFEEKEKDSEPCASDRKENDDNNEITD